MSTVGLNREKKTYLSHNQIGASVTEVMMAIVVFMVIMIGGINYFTAPQANLAREEMRRLAAAIAQQRLEALLHLDYTNVDGRFQRNQYARRDIEQWQVFSPRSFLPVATRPPKILMPMSQTYHFLFRRS